MDMLVKKEKIFDNIVAVSGTKKEAIRTISRLCSKTDYVRCDTVRESILEERRVGFDRMW